MCAGWAMRRNLTSSSPPFFATQLGTKGMCLFNTTKRPKPGFKFPTRSYSKASKLETLGHGLKLQPRTVMGQLGVETEEGGPRAFSGPGDELKNWHIQLRCGTNSCKIVKRKQWRRKQSAEGLLVPQGESNHRGRWWVGDGTHSSWDKEPSQSLSEADFIPELLNSGPKCAQRKRRQLWGPADQQRCFLAVWPWACYITIWASVSTSSDGSHISEDVF